MSEFDYGGSEGCQNLSQSLENYLVTNLIRNITVNTGTIKWSLLTYDGKYTL